MAASRIPALIPTEEEFQDQCHALALGQEINVFDAGEISTITLTAKTMAARMLRPATESGAGIINCVEFIGNVSNKDRCGDYSAMSIENPRTWTNSSNEPLNGAAGLYPGLYEYEIPSATRPRATSQNGKGNTRVGKGMHGKGQLVQNMIVVSLVMLLLFPLNPVLQCNVDIGL